MPEGITRSWRTMAMGAHPWEGVPFPSGGRTEINEMINMKEVAAGKATVGYTMTLNSEGTQPEKKVRNEFSALQSGFKIVE